MGKVGPVLKIVGKTLLVLFALGVLSLVGGVSYYKFHESRVTHAVENGALVIDQVVTTSILEEQFRGSLALEIWNGNISPHILKGDIVISVTLDQNRLEEGWIKKILRLFPDIAQSTPSPKQAALSAYIDRGERLEAGQEYESVKYEGNPPEPYSFNFRSFIGRADQIEPGEILEIKKTVAIPPGFSGFVPEVKIETIDWSGW